MYKNFQYSFVSCCLMMVFIFFSISLWFRQSAKKYLSHLSESQTSKKSYYLRLAWLIGELRNRKNEGRAFWESAIKSIWEKSLRLLETIRFCPHLARKFIIMDIFLKNFSLSHTHTIRKISITREGLKDFLFFGLTWTAKLEKYPSYTVTVDRCKEISLRNSSKRLLSSCMHLCYPLK